MTEKNEKDRVDPVIVQKCKVKLLELKGELLNRVRSVAYQIQTHDRIQGDEMDMSLALQQQEQLFINQDRIRNQLLEVELALSKIDKGLFGICEITEEPIEVERLLTLPYTRHSIEGAELLEASTRRKIGL
jgi:DnaK suppressor protein